MQSSWATRKLSERQRLVLGLVVHKHVASALPVGSRKLVRTYKLTISPATVRNEMAVLEHTGYLSHPYTSAGRVPTAQGYRYFVQYLMGEVELPILERRTIRHQFHQAREEQMGQWLRLVTTILARKSGVLAFATAPTLAHSHFRSVELLPLGETKGILVLVLEGGVIERHSFSLEHSFGSETLTHISDQLTQLFRDSTADEVARICCSLRGFSRKVADRVVQVMSVRDVRTGDQFFYEGLATVISQPEFANGTAIGRLINLLERPQWLSRALVETLTHNGVQVLIGGDEGWEALRNYGVIFTRYGVDGYTFGTLGLLGPMRMSYGWAISLVRYMAELANEFSAVRRKMTQRSVRNQHTKQMQ